MSDQKAQDIIRAAQKLMGTDELDDDLQDDFGFGVHADMKRRLETLENKVAQQEHTHTDPQVEAGERVLAKAQDAMHRGVTPEGLLDRAQKAFSNPTDIGIVSGYLAVGTHEALVKAVDMVGQAEERIEQMNASTNLTGLASEYGLGDDTVERLTAEVAQLRDVTAALLRRVGQLEFTNTAAPQMTSPVVAKGYASTDAQRTPTAAELMTRAQGVIDSPQQIGVLSSLLGDGKLEQVRMAVEAAEREHDARVRTAERKRLR